MTERGARHVQRDATRLRIGPSSLHWDGQALTIRIDETTAPWPRAVRGTVRVTPTVLHDERYALDAGARHEWWPIAPCSRVEVDLARPASRWQGHAYFDSNRGTAPLEQDFSRWHWSRARTSDGGTTVLYDVTRRGDSDLSLALRFHPARDEASVFQPPAQIALPRTGWGIGRQTRSEDASATSVTGSLEDGPFYARSLVRSQLFGEAATAVHESLDLDRFASPWVQAMLPFRMPRRR
jgi:carotenoid 1,2-hydratase